MNHMLSRNLRLFALFSAALAFLSCSHATVQEHPGFLRPVSGSTQMLVATVADWDSAAGIITAYERDDLQSAWTVVQGPHAMILAERGLAWGTGLHGGRVGEGPVKREGDRRSPAGVFRLSAVYGYAPADAARQFSMPYIAVDSTTVCVDDPRSLYYNMIVQKNNAVVQDWQTAERMLSSGPYYRWGVVIDHNMNPRNAGDGSCIFLHVWGSPDEPTTGCTSLNEEQLRSLMQWLRPNARPVLVQLPQSEYRKWKRVWDLP